MAGDSHGRFAGGVGASGVIVAKRVGFGNVAVAVKIGVFGARFPSAMRGFVMEEKQERFVFGTVVEKSERFVGRDIGGVAAVGFASVGREKNGIVITALAGKDAVEMEAGGFATEMPFAYEAGVIAGLLEIFRDV